MTAPATTGLLSLWRDPGTSRLGKASEQAVRELREALSADGIIKTCGCCYGSGENRSLDPQSSRCPACQGRGWVADPDCNLCPAHTGKRTT